MVVLNKVYVFPCTVKDNQGNVIIFEVSSLTGESKIYLGSASSLNGLAVLPGEKEDIPPMPYFADILYSLITAQSGFEGLSYTTEPTENLIRIFRPGTNDLIEIYYYEKNEEYRVMTCANLIDTAIKVQAMLKKFSPRVVVMLAYTEGNDVPSNGEISKEVSEPEEEGELLKGVTELEKRYMETEPEEGVNGNEEIEGGDSISSDEEGKE